jgi:hypothetical protein
MEKAPLHSKLLEGAPNNLARPWHLWFNKLWETVTNLKFTDLSDTPSAYTGQAGKATRVNVGETGLEFYTPSAGVTDHTLLTNIGTSTHPQLDTEKGLSVAHRADSTIHFTDASVLHNNRSDLQGGTAGQYYHLTSADNTELTAFADGGSTTHTGVDSHIADDEIHNLDYDEREMTYTAGLLTQVVYKKATVTVDTMTITYDSSDRPLQYSYTSGKVVNLVHLGTGFLSEAV